MHGITFIGITKTTLQRSYRVSFIGAIITLHSVQFMKTYVTIADTIAARIQSGDLRVGEKLPSQRIFAYDNGIASSTAGRVYAELVKRGLITGEVGRGSYVLTPPTPKDISAVLEARSDMPLDLETSFPIIENQSKLMAPALQELSRPDVLDGAMRP
ncbi:MAG TPA: hypothetical protein DCS30_07285, partial [Rhizobiales bacterium]|nr:hypothetical protein [Hyphomicrobiales bacterium]